MTKLKTIRVNVHFILLLQLLATVVLLDHSAFAQKVARLPPPCEQNVSQVSYLNLKLGMTEPQLKQVLPEAELKIEHRARRLGITEYFWTSEKYLQTGAPEILVKRGLQGVKEIWLSTFQGKVYSFNVLYDAVLWKNSKEYADFLKETLKLPVYQSKLNGDEYIDYDCREINLTASISGEEASFSLVEPRTQNAIEVRRRRLKIPERNFDVLELPK